MRNILSLILGSLLLATAPSGCVMEEDYDEFTDEQIDSDQSEVWVIGTNTQTREWNSGNTSNLSGWNQVTCAATYGTSYLLTRLRAWREPSSNLDNFVARIKGRCTEYNQVSWYMAQDTSSHMFELMYSGNYDSSRDGVTAIDVTTYIPIGVQLKTDSGGNYVKDVSLLHGHFASAGGTYYIDLYGTPHAEEWAMGLSGTTRTLLCPDQHVVAGAGVRYSTNNGKIRNFKIYCRPASDI